MPPFLGEVCINEGRNPEDQSRKWPRVFLCLGPIVPLGWLVGKTLAGDPGLPLCLGRHCPSGCPLDPDWDSAPSQCMLLCWFLCLLWAQVSIERNTMDYWIHGAHWAKSKYCFCTSWYHSWYQSTPFLCFSNECLDLLFQCPPLLLCTHPIQASVPITLIPI